MTTRPGCVERRRPRDRFGRALVRGSRDELPQAREPEEVVSSAAEACRVAADLFDQQRFFEAHEFFEYAWKDPEVADADRRFLRGVTQVAVGCCHAQRGNAVGALRLLERGAHNITGYPSPHRGIDTDGLRAVAAAVARRVSERGASPALGFAPFPRAATRGTSRE